MRKVKCRRICKEGRPCQIKHGARHDHTATCALTASFASTGERVDMKQRTKSLAITRFERHLRNQDVPSNARCPRGFVAMRGDPSGRGWAPLMMGRHRSEE